MECELQEMVRGQRAMVTVQATLGLSILRQVGLEAGGRGGAVGAEPVGAGPVGTGQEFALGLSGFTREDLLWGGGGVKPGRNSKAGSPWLGLRPSPGLEWLQ